ncbi:MAG: DUF4837 family protein [Ignavibacteria bacterium]|nr:DUF4837 family protein [Ignavibacteria bacterium]
MKILQCFNYKPFYRFNKSSILLILLFFIFFLSLSIVGCDYKKTAVGKEDEIIVFCDKSDWSNLEATLNSTFGRQIATPNNEILFSLVRKDLSEFEKFKQRKNILFVGVINSKNTVANYLNSIINSLSKYENHNKNSFIVKKYDLWANNQVVVFIGAKEISSLQNLLTSEKNNLLFAFQRMSDRRVADLIQLEKSQQGLLQKKYLNKYGWQLNILPEFKEAIDDPQGNFVWLRRSPTADNENWLFVHWIENANQNSLTKEFVNQTRNNITKKYIRSENDSFYVMIMNNSTNQTQMMFNNYPAILTQGLWQMSDGTIAGPFINYAFYDNHSKRIYLLDGSVFSPRYDNKSQLQRLDLSLKTFKTAENKN